MSDSVFCNDDAIGYMTIVHEIEQNNFLNWLVEKSSELAREKLEKKDYAEILTNLILMQADKLGGIYEAGIVFQVVQNFI